MTQTILDSSFQPGGGSRSRLIIPADELQESAESVFKAAAQLAAAGEDEGNFPLYAHLSAIARSKGFQHCTLLLSLSQQPGQAARILVFIREAIDAMGGPGDFFDILDLITLPEERVQ